MDSSPAFQTSLQFAHRECKRQQIEGLFRAHIGERISARWLHVEFGSSFRARVSGINVEPDSPLVIRNEYHLDEQEPAGVSVYRTEVRPVHKDLDE